MAVRCPDCCISTTVFFTERQNEGGDNALGTVFSSDASGSFVFTLVVFNGSNGAHPSGGLVLYKNALYGTTSAGGLYQKGTIFSVNTTRSVESVVHSFGGRGDGAVPLGGLVAINGVLYGTTELGGAHGKGTVFAFGASGEHVLHSFAGAPADGGHPTAALIRYGNALYGTTRAGGTLASGGAAYKITSFGQERVLHSFGVTRGDGQNPAAPLVLLNGEFYGTTLHGGNVSGLGTVFAMSPSGSEKVLHAFAAGEDGAFPVAGLVVVRGELYGTTMNGGKARRSGYCVSGPGSSGATCGTLFKINASGDEHVIYRFHGDPDGANAEAALTYVGGALYGTTSWGGRNKSYGTIFKNAP